MPPLSFHPARVPNAGSRRGPVPSRTTKHCGPRSTWAAHLATMARIPSLEPRREQNELHQATRSMPDARDFDLQVGDLLVLNSYTALCIPITEPGGKGRPALSRFVQQGQQRSKSRPDGGISTLGHFLRVPRRIYSICGAERAPVCSSRRRPVAVAFFNLVGNFSGQQTSCRRSHSEIKTLIGIKFSS